jgi:hypothetical protein
MVNEVKKEVVDAEAHIVESRSWGGESGSPVFLYKDDWKLEKNYNPAAYFDPFMLEISNDEVVPDVQPALLGVMHGHYTLPGGVERRDGTKIGDVNINSGIGVVLPVDHLTRLLMNEKIIQERKLIEKARRERDKPDSVSHADGG